MSIGSIRRLATAEGIQRRIEQIAGPKWRKYLPEQLIKLVLFSCATLSIFTTVGIVSVLLIEAVLFFQEVSIFEFLGSTKWTPLFSSKSFGIWPLVTGTMLTSVGAMIVALPLGLLSAIYLAEYAPDRVRRILKPVLEVLAGIPTVVYGYFALLFVTPILRQISGDISVFNALSASIVMGIMILPMVSSLSEDAMQAVPRSLREAAYALGATKLEVATRVVVPAALSGIAAAFILAASRAIGETMTAYIVQVSLGDTPTGTIEFKTIFAVGLSLFVITLGMNLLSQYFVRRFREEYE